MALQANAECVRRELQRQAVRRMSELDAVHVVGPRTRWVCRMAARLQLGQADSKLGGRTPAEIAKQAAPVLLVIPSTISQTIEGLYL